MKTPGLLSRAVRASRQDHKQGKIRKLRTQSLSIAHIVRIELNSDYASSDNSFAILHQSGWTIGDTAFRDGSGVVWLVTGLNGENRIRAESATQDEAWHRAVEQTAAVGMLCRGPGTKRPSLGSDN